jgi:hypothetical protein
VISGFRHGVDENCALNTNYLAHQMGPIGCYETSVRDYHHTRRNIPDQPSSLLSNACFQERSLRKPPKPEKGDHNGHVREDLEGDGCGLYEGSYYPRQSSAEGTMKGFRTDNRNASPVGTRYRQMYVYRSISREVTSRPLLRGLESSPQ